MCELSARGLQRVVEPRSRGAGDAEDAVLVHVLDDRPARHLTIEAAHRHDRQLAVERHERFEDQRRAGELGPTGVGVVRVPDDALALAVVAAPTRLEHGRQSDLLDRGPQLVTRPDAGELRGGDPDGTEAPLLDEPVLRHLERRVPGTHRQVCGEEPRLRPPARLPIRR